MIHNAEKIFNFSIIEIVHFANSYALSETNWLNMFNATREKTWMHKEKEKKWRNRKRKKKHEDTTWRSCRFHECVNLVFGVLCVETIEFIALMQHCVWSHTHSKNQCGKGQEAKGIGEPIHFLFLPKIFKHPMHIDTSRIISNKRIRMSNFLMKILSY